MVSEDKLIELSHVAGYSFIPSQEVFIPAEDNLSSRTILQEYHKEPLNFYFKAPKKILLSIFTRILSLREPLLSWIQRCVHV